MKKRQLVAPLVALVLTVASTGIFVAAAHADTTTPAATALAPADQGTHQKPAAVGTVTAVSGDTITLTDKMSGTRYTVDATNATVMKMGTPSTSATSAASSSLTSGTPMQPPAPTTIAISDIAIGDTIMVQGTVSGDSITATQIMDGQPPMGGGRGGQGGGPGGPGINGTVTAVNGSTLTITGSNGTTYTVDDSAATATKMETLSVSDIAVGDTVGIDGSVSGTSVTAKHIMDGIPAPQQSGSAAAVSGS